MPKGALTPLVVRLWAKIDKSGDCWLWHGPRKSNGYGVISRGRRSDGYAYVHRLAWEMANGPIPSGLQVLHRCDVRNCARPDHLFLGTPADNMHDMHRKGRAAKVELTRHCGEANGRARLKQEQIPGIRARHAAGETIVTISRSLGVGETTIRNIVKGRRWRDDLSVRSGEVLHA